MRCSEDGAAHSPAGDLATAGGTAALCQQVHTKKGRGIRHPQEANKTASPGSSGLSQGRSVTESSGEWVRNAEAVYNVLMPHKRKVRVRPLLPSVDTGKESLSQKGFGMFLEECSAVPKQSALPLCIDIAMVMLVSFTSQ